MRSDSLKPNRPLAGLVLILVSALMCGTVWAQSEGGDIVGVVTDESGGVIPGVTITATNLANNVSLHTLSDDQGNYAFRFLRAGRYRIKAEMSSFMMLVVPEVALQIGFNKTLPLVMKVGGVDETVTVTANSNKVDSTTATVKYSVTNELVRGLPIFTSTTGRSVIDQLVLLVPGVTPSSSYGAGDRGTDMTVNGSRRQGQNFVFEGGDNNDFEYGRAASPMPNPDALQEFTVVTNNYQADMGRTNGGIISATSKSGSNSFHGNVRYFALNEAFNAREFFDGRRAKQRLNTYGGQIGGPVVVPGLYNGRDRTHFFFDYEGTGSDREQKFDRPLLTLKERSGDFSESPPYPLDPLTKKPFPNNIIPAERIDPISKRYLEHFIPEPNNRDRYYTTFMPSNDSNDQFTTRVDHKVGEHDLLSGTYFYTAYLSDSASTTTLPIGSRQVSESENHNFVLRETHTFSPRLVNQFTGTVTRYVNNFLIYSPGLEFLGPSQLGFTNVTPQTSRYLGPPTVVISGTGVQTTTVSGTEAYKTTWQVKDDFSHSLGSHSVKSGVEIRGFIFNRWSANNNGSFNFSTTNSYGTKNALADFILGMPNSFSQNTGQGYAPRQKAYYLYLMDDWRVSRNLTLNVGLRYEIVPPLYDLNDQYSVFRPGASSQRLPDAPVGLLFVGDPDPILGVVPRGGYPTDKNNFAPRVGIVYSPRPEAGWLKTLFGDGKTAIRTGAGVFYDNMYGFSLTQNTSTQPFSVTQSVPASEIYGAGGTFADPWGSNPNPFPLDLTERKFVGKQSIQPVDPRYRTAYTYQYNLTVQRELPSSLLFEIGYVGSNSFKLNMEEQLNPAIVGPGATTGNVDARRIYQDFRAVPNQMSKGRSHYNSLQTRISRRFTQGLFFDASYVWSKSMDNASEPQLSQLAGLHTPTWALSSYDRRHQFVTSYTYALPFRVPGVVGNIVSGWEIGGRTTFRTGIPIGVCQYPDPSLTGMGMSTSIYGSPDLVGPFTTFDPRRYQTIEFEGKQLSGNFFFDPRAFRTITVNDWTEARSGNLGRNTFSGPGMNQWDVSFMRQFHVYESHELELRADVVNLFNHAQFLLPSQMQSTSSATFGQVSTYYNLSARHIQMSLRYTF